MKYLRERVIFIMNGLEHISESHVLWITTYSIFVLEAGSYEMTNQHVKQNGKLEDNPSSGSPPRTTLLGTIFSPVFNFFSPANKNGKYKPLAINSL